MENPEVSVNEVPEDAAIVDVREPDEWVAGRIQGATHIPLGDLPARRDELPDADELYIVCRSGGRSGNATAWLNEQGINAINIAGGMRAWAAAGKPMIAHGDVPPEVI